VDLDGAWFRAEQSQSLIPGGFTQIAGVPVDTTTYTCDGDPACYASFVYR
jgi:hypothetical protein